MKKSPTTQLTLFVYAVARFTLPLLSLPFRVPSLSFVNRQTNDHRRKYWDLIFSRVKMHLKLSLYNSYKTSFFQASNLTFKSKLIKVRRSQKEIVVSLTPQKTQWNFSRFLLEGFKKNKDPLLCEIAPNL